MGLVFTCLYFNQVCAFGNTSINSLQRKLLFTLKNEGIGRISRRFCLFRFRVDSPPHSESTKQTQRQTLQGEALRWWRQWFQLIQEAPGPMAPPLFYLHLVTFFTWFHNLPRNLSGWFFLFFSFFPLFSAVLMWLLSYAFSYRNFVQLVFRQSSQ